MYKNGWLCILGNDEYGRDDMMERIKAELPFLSITDAMHLMTAIKKHCCLFVTTDPHFGDVQEALSNDSEKLERICGENDYDIKIKMIKI
jgi:hypothetical protein